MCRTFFISRRGGGGLLRERLFPAPCGKCGLPICKLLPAPPLPQFIRKSLIPGAVLPLPLRRMTSEEGGGLLRERLFPAPCGKCGLPICKLLPAPPLPQFIRKSLIPGAVLPLPLRRSEATDANGRLFPTPCGYVDRFCFSFGRRAERRKKTANAVRRYYNLQMRRACPRKYTIFGGITWLLMQRKCLRK